MQRKITVLLIGFLLVFGLLFPTFAADEKSPAETTQAEKTSDDCLTDNSNSEDLSEKVKEKIIENKAVEETANKPEDVDVPQKTLKSENEFSLSMLYYDSRVNSGRTALVSPCVYEEDKIAGTLNLQVNILGENITRDYAPGEVEFKVYGLEKFGLTNVSIQGSIFTYEHHAGTFNPETRQVEDDYYIIRNKQAISQDSSVDAMFQILYRLGSSEAGCPFNETSATVHAEYNDTPSNELSFAFNMPKQQYTYNGNDSQFNITSSDSLGDDWDDYYWIRTGYQSQKTINPSRTITAYTTKSVLGLKGLSPNCKVFYLDYNAGKILNTEYNPETQAYEYYSSPPTAYIVLGLPKSEYNVGDPVALGIDWDAPYYYKNPNNVKYYGELEDVFDKTINLVVKDTIQPTPDGTLMTFTNYISGDDFYTSNLMKVNNRRACIGYTYSARNPQPYKISFGFDGIYFKNTQGESVLLGEDEYHITSVSTPYASNANEIKLYEQYDLYVKYRGENDYVLYRENVDSNKTINFKSNETVIAAYVISSALSGQCHGSGSSSSLECQLAFDNQNDHYETNGYVGVVGFMDIYDAETNEPISSVQETSYSNIANQLGFPDRDIQEFGRYRFRKEVEKKIKPDDYVGYIGIKDILVKDTAGYSDFNLVTYLGYASKTSTSSVSGYDAYVELPPQVKLNASAEDIKESVISTTLKNYLNDETSSDSINGYVARSTQFDSIDEYLSFLHNALTVTVSEKDGNTIIGLHYEYPEELELVSVISGTSQTFSAVLIPVRVYDTDVLDYGNNIEIAGYAQPILNNGANFYNYNSNGGFPTQHFSRLLINPNNRNSSSAYSGYNWPDTNDIDEDGDKTERFNEFHSKVIYGKAMEALQEFSKLVDTDHSHWKPGASYVATDSDYSYRLRTRSAATGMTNLVMYDHIEIYAPDDTDSWHGHYTGIDLSRATAQGYTPTVYYSEKSDAGSLSEDDSWKPYNDGIDWTEVMSLAFDYGEQIIQPNSIVSVDIKMHAPSTDSDLYTYNRYETEWRRVDVVTNYVFPDIEEMGSNVTVVSLGEPIDDTRIITITKTWEESTPNPDRPDEITVNLYRDGELYGEYAVKASENWQKKISNLPRFDFDTGEEYEYTITENAVENYNTQIDGFDITNIYDPKLPVPTGVENNTPIKSILMLCALYLLFYMTIKYKRKK